MKCNLESICDYRQGRVKVSELNHRNYISTENMLPNKSGITTASSLPSIESTQKFKQGDILVSNIRPYFKKIWKAKYDGGCSNDVLVFTAKEGIDQDFLYYVLSDDSFFGYVMATSKGTKMPRGDKKTIMKYQVPLFKIEKQEKIASILCKIDARIELNKEINNNLEELAQVYFNKLFIANPKTEWSKGSLSDLGTIVGGGTPSKQHLEYYMKDGIPWITPKDLSKDNSKFIIRGEKDISEVGFKNSSAVKIPRGSILFSSRAPIGYIAIAANEVTTSQGFKSVVPKKNASTAYIYYFLKHNLPVIESLASGSTFKEISGAGMKSVPTYIPDEATMLKFSDFCAPIFNKQEILEAENKKLTVIRDSLLPKLLSGEHNLKHIAF